MTDREKAIVMAYTGICMLEGARLYEFYAYLKELYSRPVYSHELLTLNIKERSEKDFMDLCREVDRGRRTGTWRKMNHNLGYECSLCGWESDATYNFCPNCGANMDNFRPNCGADMRGEQNETDRC